MALVERLAEVLPPGFSITSNRSDLWLDTPDNVGCSAWAGGVDRDPTDLERYAGAAESVLSNIQDGVSETLKDPWPRLDAPGRQMAMPGARLVGDTLTMWYGREEAPVLRLRPITLSEIELDR